MAILFVHYLAIYSNEGVAKIKLIGSLAMRPDLAKFKSLAIFKV